MTNYERLENGLKETAKTLKLLTICVAVVGILIAFDLSDEFQGGLAEAFEEVARYIREKGNPTIDSISTPRATGWDVFLDVVKKGKRISGEISLVEWVNGKWEPIGGKK